MGEARQRQMFPWVELCLGDTSFKTEEGQGVFQISLLTSADLGKEMMQHTRGKWDQQKNFFQFKVPILGKIVWLLLMVMNSQCYYKGFFFLIHWFHADISLSETKAS